MVNCQVLIVIQRSAPCIPPFEGITSPLRFALPPFEGGEGGCSSVFRHITIDH